MQISANNLLIAAGQPRAAARPGADGFAAALGEAKAAAPRPFEPPSLESEPAKPEPALPQAAAPAPSSTAYAPAMPPGANLDIRV